jgi:hypothetical protein
MPGPNQRLRDLTPLLLVQTFSQLSDHGGKKSKTFPQGRPLAPKTVREIAFLTANALKRSEGLGQDRA